MMALIITKMDEEMIKMIRHLTVHDVEDINDDDVEYDGKGSNKATCPVHVYVCGVMLGPFRQPAEHLVWD